jgi:hypothetical protein
VHHKDGIGIDFVPELQKRITGNPERVHWIHWGEHQATNDFADVRNVILAGTLFYRPRYYEALTRLAADKRPAQGALARSAVADVTIGEHRHLILQAPVGAAFVAVKVRGALPVMPTSSPLTGRAFEALPSIFPGCRVERWSPVKKELRGKVKEAVEFVVDWFKENPDGLLRFNVVQRAIGIAAAGTFKSDVRRHSDFIEALDNHDITEAWRMGDKRRGFLKPIFVEDLF